MTLYMMVTWHHHFPDEPVFLFSEVEQGREVRKVEVYGDGSRGFADTVSAKGSTQLSETLMPTMDEIAMDPEFTPKLITQEEFEAQWSAAVNSP